MEKMEHNRELIIGVILREGPGINIKILEPEVDTTHIADAGSKKKEMISLDACL